MFYANSTDPAVPSVLADVVLGFRSLNNFRLKPKAVKRSVDDAVLPQFTSSTSGNHYLSPSDFAVIYNLAGLYAAGLDGSGQKIAVVGQTDIQFNDFQMFRSVSRVPPNHPESVLVPGIANPG